MYSFIAISSIISVGLIFLVHKFLQKRGKEKDLLFYGGLFHILVFLPAVYSWYLYISILFILIGIFYLFLSSKNIPFILQAMLVLLPLTVLISFSIYSESSNNIFLIPKGYTGRVVIVHGCKDGEPREFEGTYRVYRIGKDGLLKSKFSFAGNAFDSLHSRYYYVDENGKKEEISQNTGTGIYPQGLWTLHYEKKGETIIDFILDKEQENPQDYKKEENEKWQKEIDSCN